MQKNKKEILSKRTQSKINLNRIKLSFLLGKIVSDTKLEYY